jgi:hypothetical protein
MVAFNLKKGSTGKNLLKACSNKKKTGSKMHV